MQGRTDLALELQKERIENQDIDGIKVIIRQDQELEIKETTILVENEEGAEAIGKPVGAYITLESAHLGKEDEDFHREMSEALSDVLKYMLGSSNSILVIGLGNQNVTADSLGPRTAENIYITRHLVQKNYYEDMIEISALSPGVMAQTGMETSEIIEGMVKQVGPDFVVAIDALAARGPEHLGRTIQISNTGIVPGSGVGNHRNAINEDSVGVPVIAIGVPMVVSVPSIVDYVLESVVKLQRGKTGLEETGMLTEEDWEEIANRLEQDTIQDMYVTPKTIDEMVNKISRTIGEAINSLLKPESINISPPEYSKK